MERRTFIATLGSGVSVSLAGCLGAGGNPTEDDMVTMTISRFRPEELTVTPGTTVTFHNTSSHTHTVTAFQDAYPDEASFWSTGDFETTEQAREGWTDDGSGRLKPGSEFTHTFEYEGTYAYFCIPHYVPDQGTAMEGRIVADPEA